MKINGKEIANKILEDLERRIGFLEEKGIVPQLAIIVIGDDPASASYVRQKEIKARNIGIITKVERLPKTVTEEELLSRIARYNGDKNTHGIIVQQPLPPHVNLENTISAIDPKKDVDGFHPNSCFEMPIGLAVLRILEEIGIRKEDLRTKKIVVVGKGKTGGKPIINALEREGLQPQIVDSSTSNPQLLTKQADILISAVGKPNIIKPLMIKNGAVLIGVGISRGQSAKLMGDYDEKEVEYVASYYTPTPGGAGPVDVAMLLANTVGAAEIQNN